MVIRSIVFLLTMLVSVYSSAVAFEASVDRTTVGEGESILLTVKYNANIFTGNPDLSVLKKDFDVISQNRKINFQYINGRSDSWTIWTIALIPKSKGKLTIPSISFKGETTQPITVNVTKISNAIKQQQKDVFFHTEIDVKTTYVQAQVIYTEKLYFSVPLVNHDLSPVKVDEAVTEQLGDVIHYKTQLNGKSYEVFERKTAIFPQVSGEMVIPGPIYSGDVGSRFFGGGRPVRVSHPPIRLQILPKPASYPSSQPWIPAQDLALDFTWRGNPQQLEVGEPITLDLSLRGQGLSSAQLPDLKLAAVKGLKYYPDQAQTTENKDASGITGVKKQSIAIVATQSGSITLPEIRIPWWNIERQQLEFAVLPAQRLSSNGAEPSTKTAATDAEEAPLVANTQSASAAAQKEQESGFNIWMIVSGILLVGWLTTLAIWFTRPKTAALEAPSSNDPHGSKFNAKRLKTACRDNQPEDARLAVLDWASHIWNQPVSSLAQAIQLCDDQTLSSALSELDYTLYSQSGNSAWQGEYLWQLINGYKPTTKKPAGPLTPLYPV